MSGPRLFLWLLRHDVRRVSRTGTVWIILFGVIGACVAGARTGAALHASQRADLARVAAAERAWYGDIADRVRRFSVPSSLTLPYWQDPTDAAAFSRYFLRRHAAKPHLPLSPLAVGHSDLQPYAVPVRLDGLFGGEPVYDYEHPRALATGLFDLEFALVWLLPLGLGAIVAVAGAAERDHGIMPFIASQPVSPRVWHAARGAAIATVSIPTMAVGVAAALVLSGVPLRGAPEETAAMLLLIAAQSLLWIAVALAFVARGAGAVSAMAAVIGVWLVLTIGLPLAGSAVLALALPPPSYARHVDRVRDATDTVQAERDVVIARALSAFTGSRVPIADSSRYDYSTRQLMLTPETERRLQDEADARTRRARAQAMAGAVMEWLSPQLAFQSALEALAGTDARRHQRFARELRAFQLRLRDFMYPRVLRQAITPAAPSCTGCPGRLNFLDFEAIPKFSFEESSARQRSSSAVASALWILVAAGVVQVFARPRGWSLF